ncbi:MAG: oxidoreductase [Flavobacteriales bacterium]|nr:oxidoreductase [Flavobacteriales bacterium]|tara:strand:- start:14653 stop:15318 length:666 start_codon:yes stop_codon:yes gene_type:complete
MKKILLIGASSDICKQLYKDFNANYEFLLLSSDNEECDYENFDILNRQTYPKISAIDGIVYFPGTINLKPFERFKEDDFTDDYNINVKGLVNILQFYKSSLNKGSSVVCFSTVAAKLGMPFHASIAMCKASVSSLCRTLAAEWSPNIRVNCISPSLVDTKMGSKFFRNEQQIELMNSRHPLKRTGRKTDISNFIEFLLSEKSSWVTGQDISIDGGMSTVKA